MSVPRTGDPTSVYSHGILYVSIIMQGLSRVLTQSIVTSGNMYFPELVRHAKQMVSIRFGLVKMTNMAIIIPYTRSTL